MRMNATGSKGLGLLQFQTAKVGDPLPEDVAQKWEPIFRNMP